MYQRYRIEMKEREEIPGFHESIFSTVNYFQNSANEYVKLRI
jgi:hypothetical protein